MYHDHNRLRIHATMGKTDGCPSCAVGDEGILMGENRSKLKVRNKVQIGDHGEYGMVQNGSYHDRLQMVPIDGSINDGVHWCCS